MNCLETQAAICTRSVRGAGCFRRSTLSIYEPVAAPANWEQSGKD